MKRYVVVTLCALFVTFTVSAARLGAQGGYDLIEIGPGHLVMDMNGRGEVVGYQGVQFFVWSAERGYIVQGGGGQTPAYTGGLDFNPNRLAINVHGVVVGTGIPSDNRGTQPAVRSATGGWTLLSNFAEHAYGGATAINDSGQVTGYSQGGGYNTYGPFIADASGGIQRLAGFDPDPMWTTYGFSYDINNAGEVTGYCGGILCGGARPKAFFWSPREGLVVIASAGPNGIAIGHAVNDHGVVVGTRHASAPDGSTLDSVFRWTRESGIEDLEAPSGFPERLAINNAGDIVLTVALPGAGNRAYLYRNSRWIALRALVADDGGFRPDYAVAINDAGMIAGYGSYYSPAEQRGFILVPDDARGGDTDADGDGTADDDDAFPHDPEETHDTDGDGAGDNTDPDDDNDGQSDADESACGSDPLDSDSRSADRDYDGLPDCLDDHTPPDISVPPDMTVEATGPAGAAVTYQVSAVDDRDPQPSIVCEGPASGAVFGLGDTTVTCTATDASGNTAVGRFTVRVVDTTAPSITAVHPSGSLWPPNGKMVDVGLTVTASDAVDPAPACAVVSVVANEGIDASDWSLSGPLALQLRARRSGTLKAGRIYTVSIRCLDASQNAAFAQATFVVAHDQRR